MNVNDHRIDNYLDQLDQLEQEHMRMYEEPETQEPTIKDQLRRLRDMKAELQPHIDNMKALEKQIKAHLLETGEKPDVDGVTVSFRRGYVRTSWDSKALNGYAAAHPEIEQFRTEREIGPSVSIKVEV